MNSTTFRMPARRSAAVLAALAVLGAAGALVPAAAADSSAGPADEPAGPADGTAHAAVLRTGLDVSLLHRTAAVPLHLALNEVTAPRSAEKTALTATLEGVDEGRPFDVLRAEVASARATAGAREAAGRVELVHARVHVPGLPLLSLIEAEQVTADAVCPVDGRPTARGQVLGTVTVLGKRVSLTAGGTTTVDAPGVGTVKLTLSDSRTASRTAAATALRLGVSVNPLNLDVTDVKGSVTLAEASCTSPAAVRPATATEPAAEEQDLAETGGNAATPYLAGGAAVLVAAGAGALVWTRRRRG